MFSLIETLVMQTRRLRNKGFDQPVSVTVTDKHGEPIERIVTIRAISQADSEKLANRYRLRWQAQLQANKLAQTFGFIGRNHLKDKDKKGFLNVFKVYSYQQALNHAIRPLGIRHGKLLSSALTQFSNTPLADTKPPSPAKLKRRLKYTLYHVAFNLGFVAVSMASVYIGQQIKGHSFVLLNPYYIFAFFCGLVGLMGVLKNIRDRHCIKRMLVGAVD